MTTTTPRPLRALFLTLALVLAAFAGVEVAIAGTASRDAEGLTACGTEAAPCMLEPVAIEAAPRAAHFVATSPARTAMRIRT